MQLSRSWLSDYVDLPSDNTELDRVLTNVGLEVEFIEDRAASLNHFVVGRVLTCEKHPNADKLSVCTVADGAGEHTVVCGAPNVAAGQNIIFAREGAVVPNGGFTIEKRKLRGVESRGMICSLAELKLSEDHSGIAVLDEQAEVGTPIAEYLGMNDAILGIGITPNRGDALSHIGVARDIAAALRSPLRMPAVSDLQPADMQAFDIDIRNSELCPRYSAAVIRGVRVADSPEWLKRRLIAADIRPINNIVDVTNFVMMEIGQPMHAFDLARLTGDRIVVRTAEAGERMYTLDDQERELPTGALLICDAQRPVAVAGVMGGKESAVAESSTDILLESAHFHPSSVRRTARQLGLSTDSSYRFERGTDIAITTWALRRAVGLILEIAGGTLRGMYDAWPGQREALQVLLRPERTDAVLGISIPAEEQAAILRALQYEVTPGDGGLQCRVPTFRTDVEREIDLIEEIARIHGYDNIPVPERISMNTTAHFDDQAFADTLRDVMLGFGFDEVMSSSLVSPEHARIGTEAIVEVRNPVSKERPALRGSLLSSLLEAVDHNIRNGSSSMRMFEIGRVYARAEEGFDERGMMAFACTGEMEERSWMHAPRLADVFDAKGTAEALLAALRLDKDSIFCYDRHTTLSDQALTVEVKGNYVGQITEVPEALLASFGIRQPVFYAEFAIDGLRAGMTVDQRYEAVPRYPAVHRDLAVLVSAELAAERLLTVARGAAGALLRSIAVVDVFTHESLGANKKSVALTMTFQSPERTLKEEEIQASVNGILEALRKELQAELRS